MSTPTLCWNCSASYSITAAACPECKSHNANNAMTKHPDCEDCCQIYEHKGYISCQLSGQCAYAEAA